VVGIAVQKAVLVGGLQQDAEETEGDQALLALDIRGEQARRSPADGVRRRTGGGTLIQSTTSSGIAAGLRGSRYERYRFRGVFAFPLPGELGHELVHVEVVAPPSDLAVRHLERSHHRQLDGL